nr:hypothetical protein GCM10020092_080780 [Actinoplanes digitatis]
MERGQAPGTLAGVVRDADGRIVRSQPICRYPEVAAYRGAWPSHRGRKLRLSAFQELTMTDYVNASDYLVDRHVAEGRGARLALTGLLATSPIPACTRWSGARRTCSASSACSRSSESSCSWPTHPSS